MNEITTEDEAPAALRRCGIDEVFASPFIELIGLAPQNPVVRGLILAQTGRMPGPERLTFEAIKEWVETTCQKKPRLSTSPAPRVLEGISLTVEFSQSESGTATYTVPRSGSAEFTLDGEELLTLVQRAIEAGEDLDGLIELIAQEIHDEAWHRCDPELDDAGDYDYGQHECTDTEDASVEFSRGRLRERLLGFLRERHPALLEELQ